MQAVSMLLNGMAMVIPMVGAHTPLGLSVAKALSDIGKHVPPGASSPQGDNNAMQQMQQRALQMQSQRAAMGAQGGPPGGAPPPGGAAPPPGGPPRPPMAG